MQDPKYQQAITAAGGAIAALDTLAYIDNLWWNQSRLSIELEELLAEQQAQLSLVSGNHAVYRLLSKELIGHGWTIFGAYQADIFQVPCLISLFGIQPPDEFISL